MKHRIAIAAIILCLFGAGSAQAQGGVTLQGFLRGLLTSVPVPHEWSGVWSTIDTTYDCDLNYKTTTAGQDTLCTGQEVFPPGGQSFSIDCTGTANSTSVHMHCTGSGEIIAGCTENVDITIDAELSGDSYYAVTVDNITFTGPYCIGLPNQCLVNHSHGTRTSAEPATCATPAQPSTWGKLKANYR